MTSPQLNLKCRELFLTHSINTLVSRGKHSKDYLRFLTLSKKYLHASRCGNVYQFNLIIDGTTNPARLSFGALDGFCCETDNSFSSSIQKMLLLLEPKHVRVKIYRHFNLNKCAMLVATLKHVKCLISIESNSRKVNCSLLVNILASNLRQITCAGADIVEATPLALDFCKLEEPLDDEDFYIITRRHTIKCLEFERGRENFWVDPETPASSRPQITSVKAISTNCAELGDASAFLQMLASNNVRLTELNIRIFNKPIWKATKFNVLVKKIREQCKSYFDLKEIAERVAFKTSFYFCLQVMVEFAELTRNTWFGDLTQVDLFKNCRYHKCGNRYLFELSVEEENVELKIQLLVVG